MCKQGSTSKSPLVKKGTHTRGENARQAVAEQGTESALLSPHSHKVLSQQVDIKKQIALANTI